MSIDNVHGHQGCSSTTIFLWPFQYQVIIYTAEYRTIFMIIANENVTNKQNNNKLKKAVDKAVDQKCNMNLDWKSNSLMMKVVIVHYNRG